MSKTQVKYSTGEANTPAEDLSKHLNDELRMYIRSLTMFPPLSPEWISIIQGFQHIASVATVEDKLPEKNSNPDSTLWERERLSIRYLLEEAKLNLILRCIIDYSNFKRSATFESVTLQKSGDFQTTVKALKSKMDTFENSSGTILKFAFQSVECLQTCDISALISHCSDELSFAIEKNISPMEGMQEVFAINYLAAVLQKIDSVNENRVMASMAEKNIFVLVTKYIDSHTASPLSLSTTTDCACFYSYLFDTESWGANESKYFPNDDVKRKFLNIYEKIFVPFEKNINSDLKKQLKPLFDTARSIKRQLK